MGAKSRQPTNQSPTPSSASGPAADSATPDQDTLGNAAIAAEVGRPKQDESSLLLDEGDDLGTMWRETQIVMGSPSFFAEQATDEERYRMIHLTPPGRMADLVAGASLGTLWNLLGPARLETKLKVVRARPRLLAGLDDATVIALVFDLGAYDLAQKVTDKQLGALQNAEGATHPKLVKALRQDVGYLLPRALEGIGYDDCIHILVGLGARSSAVIVETNLWNRQKIGQYLDAANRMDGGTFAAFEQLWHDLGRGDAVQWWYQQREKRG